MAGASMTSVSAKKAGKESCATQSFAIRGAMITVNARTELACASLDGTESIAQLKDVLEGEKPEK